MEKKKHVKSCHSATTILYDEQKTCLVFDLAFELGISLKTLF